MFITITTSKVKPDQSDMVEEFLEGYLPKVGKLPGVMAVYHYNRPKNDDDSTIIGWKDVKSLEAYREGDLIKEAMDFMRKLGSESVMEAYPLAYPAEDDNIEI